MCLSALTTLLRAMSTGGAIRGRNGEGQGTAHRARSPFRSLALAGWLEYTRSGHRTALDQPNQPRSERASVAAAFVLRCMAPGALAPARSRLLQTSQMPSSPHARPSERKEARRPPPGCRRALCSPPSLEISRLAFAALSIPRARRCASRNEKGRASKEPRSCVEEQSRARVFFGRPLLLFARRVCLSTPSLARFSRCAGPYANELLQTRH